MADVENKEVVSEEVSSTETVKESPVKKPVEAVPETNGTAELENGDTAETNGDAEEAPAAATNGDPEETNGDSKESHDVATNGSTEKSSTKRKSAAGDVEEEVEAPEKKSKVTEETEEPAEEPVTA